MPRTRFDHWPCSVARTADLLADSWGLLILREAFYGTRRFEQFTDTLGIGRKVLTQRLGRLVEAGMFDKVAYQQRPLRHEYRLTPMGRSFFDVVLAMMRFGDDWLTPDGAPILLRSGTTGEPIRPVVVDANTGQPIDLRTVVTEPGPGFPDVHLERARREGKLAQNTSLPELVGCVEAYEPDDVVETVLRTRSESQEHVPDVHHVFVDLETDIDAC